MLKEHAGRVYNNGVDNMYPLILEKISMLQYWFSKMGQAFSVGLAPANAG